MTFLFAGLAMAQSFSGPVTYYNVEYGSTLVLDGDHWEFRVIGRKGFLRMLSEIHGRDGYYYEVKWGKDFDRLRIRRQPKPAAHGRSAFEETLLHAIRAVAMTYRVEGDIYNIVARPIPVQDDGLQGPDESAIGKRSLDVLARCLSERGIGYRVDGARSSAIDLQAPFASLRQTLWIVQELDNNLDIDAHDGIVVRNEFFYR